MNATRIRTVSRHLAAALPPRGERPATDAELLSRFLDAHDAAAFASLAARHLPAVRAVCRSVLRDPNDADDAVQATFLVLVRRAAAVRDRLALGAWLCRVAWRAANRLREANVRRSGRQAPGINPDTTPVRQEPAAVCGETAAALHDEIGRLPERYRLAVLTCYAAGTPTAEAAARLGWPKGTLLTRLAWARRRLRDRLSKRGVTPGALAGLCGAAGGSAGGAVLAGRIAAAAVAVLVGDPAAKELVSERVLSLTEGVVRAMVGTKIKLAVGIGFVAVALLGLGLGRMSAGAADAADKKPLPAVAGSGAKTGEPAAPPKVTGADPEARADVGPVAPAGPGNDLVVRRPLGSFTKEVAPFGRATFTFTENRLHVHAAVTVEKMSFLVSADADYSLNRESVVYGIITGADISAPGGGGLEAAVAFAPFAAVANDLPFCFRVRVEDDAITIKDLKVGPFGSPLLAEALNGGGGDAKEMMTVMALVCGKYKADPNPDRDAPVGRPRRK